MDKHRNMQVWRAEFYIKNNHKYELCLLNDVEYCVKLNGVSLFRSYSSYDIEQYFLSIKYSLPPPIEDGITLYVDKRIGLWDVMDAIKQIQYGATHVKYNCAIYVLNNDKILPDGNPIKRNVLLYTKNGNILYGISDIKIYINELITANLLENVKYNTEPESEPKPATEFYPHSYFHFTVAT